MLFRSSLAISSIVGDTLLLLLVLLIARGVAREEIFALRRPRSWPDAVRTGTAVIGIGYVVSAILIATFGFAAREQAIQPFWDGTRAGAYVASVFAIAIYAPFVEELTCRGAGFRLLEPYGMPVAIGGSALAFALMHGAIIDFPWVLTLGLGLGYLRARTGSIYPSLLVHGTVNGIAVLTAAVAGATA